MLLMLLGAVSCGSTEPIAGADGTFDALVIDGGSRRKLSGTASFGKDRRMMVELTQPFPDGASDARQWYMAIVFPTTAPPKAGADYYSVGHDLLDASTSGWMEEQERLRGEPVYHTWRVDAGEVHVQAASPTLITGTFTLDAASGMGEKPIRVTGSFRATKQQ